MIYIQCLITSIIIWVLIISIIWITREYVKDIIVFVILIIVCNVLLTLGSIGFI